MCAWPWPWPITCTSSSVDGSSIRGARRSCKPSERSCRNTWESGSEPMRAMAVVDYAEPLQLIDLPEPTVPDGWVLLRILTCGVCYSDLKTARGHMPYSAQLRLPHLVGHEIAGEVVRAGPETGFAPGERVVVYNYW